MARSTSRTRVAARRREYRLRTWIDVSVPLRTNMVRWPGDPPVRIERVLDFELGHDVAVSRLDMGTHTGTHIDAPAHFVRDGASLDAMPFAATVGRARVVAIRNRRMITPEELVKHRLRPGERVLFRTTNSSRCWHTNDFIEDFVHVTPAAARFLVERGVRTVGVDYLSVGGLGSGGDETHLVLLDAGIWIIEGLNLARVRPGRYDLICLPLRVHGAEGAPARAIVRPLRPRRQA